MSRKRMTAALVFLAALAGFGVLSPRASVIVSPPPGVAADAWHPISETLGLAIRDERDRRGQRELFGTLMVRQEGRWQAVNVSPSPVGIAPAR